VEMKMIYRYFVNGIRKVIYIQGHLEFIREPFVKNRQRFTKEHGKK
jgi:hypothetical protein